MGSKFDCSTQTVRHHSDYFLELCSPLLLFNPVGETNFGNISIKGRTSFKVLSINWISTKTCHLFAVREHSLSPPWQVILYALKPKYIYFYNQSIYLNYMAWIHLRKYLLKQFLFPQFSLFSKTTGSVSKYFVLSFQITKPPPSNLFMF